MVRWILVTFFRDQFKKGNDKHLLLVINVYEIIFIEIAQRSEENGFKIASFKIIPLHTRQHFMCQVWKSKKKHPNLRCVKLKSMSVRKEKIETNLKYNPRFFRLAQFTVLKE